MFRLKDNYFLTNEKGKVVSVDGGVDAENRNMVIKRRNGRRTQIWYFHQQSLTIRTRYNNQSWDIKNSGKTNEMQIWSTNSGWF
jgi:membrane carboxypeptidase/penicillin-binding protein PbpC